MIIKSADFLYSLPRVEQCPDTTRAEFAFIGRSNVGKSSLINMLTGRKSLAKVSGTPGKTQMINHFLINEEWELIDLPGYGYARIAKSKQERFSKLIEGYVTKRENLNLLFVLIDSRHAPQKIDLNFFRFLGEEGIPFAIIFTKTDKLSATQLANNVEIYSQQLLTEWEELPKMFFTSSENGAGHDEVLDYIEKCLKSQRLFKNS